MLPFGGIAFLRPLKGFGKLADENFLPLGAFAFATSDSTAEV